MLIDFDKIVYIPEYRPDYSEYEVDISHLKNIKERYFHPDKFNVFFLGRIIPVKGIDILLNAVVPLQNNLRVIISGDDSGEYAQSCKKYAELNNLDVLFTGPIGSGKGKHFKEVIYYYLNSDLFVLPNKYVPREYEAVEVWGYVIDEALYLKKPVLVTDVTGCSDDLVKGQNTGIIINNNSIDELRSALRDFIKHPEKWKKMGENGPKAEAKTTHLNILGWEKLYEALCR